MQTWKPPLMIGMAVTLVVSVCALFGSAVAHANPIPVWQLQGTVYVTENGHSSNETTSVELSCQSQVYEWVDVVEVGQAGKMGTPTRQRRMSVETSTSSWPCQRGECPFEEILPGVEASCNWSVHTPDGATVNYPWRPTGTGHEEVRIDLAGGPFPSASPVSTSGNGKPIGPPALDVFLAALLLAWIVELPVVFLLLRYIFRPPYRDTKRLLGVALLATLVTLPLAWYALPFIRSVLTLGYWAYIALVEAFVVALEAYIFAGLLRLTAWKAALVSLLANGLSFLVGLAIPWGTAL